MMTDEKITIVTGLPRSGTSMMMQILEAGGMEVLMDNFRIADKDNPRGYYEVENVKQLKDDSSFLEKAKGKAVKIITRLLIYLPFDYSYKLIFVSRKMEEILASQKMMLIRRGKPTDTVDDKKLSGLFQRHLKDIKTWISLQPNIDVLYTDYNEILENPLEPINKIDRFFENKLDVTKMVGIVDRTLYRQIR